MDPADHTPRQQFPIVLPNYKHEDLCKEKHILISIYVCTTSNSKLSYLPQQRTHSLVMAEHGLQQENPPKWSSQDCPWPLATWDLIVFSIQMNKPLGITHSSVPSMQMTYTNTGWRNGKQKTKGSNGEPFVENTWYNVSSVLTILIT